MSQTHFTLNDDLPVDLNLRRLVIASWTGRDRAALERHIAELKASGVETPASVPCFYNIAHTLLTTEAAIEVVGDRSTGEVEAVLIHDEQHGLLVGVGSDHTDRKVEHYDVAVAKQVCAKPLGKTLWRYADVADHWDKLVARSWRTTQSGEKVLYQEGTLARLLEPKVLAQSVFHAAGLPVGTALFCGTQPVIGELSSAGVFELELHDPVRGRSLRHRYAVTELAHQR